MEKLVPIFTKFGGKVAHGPWKKPLWVYSHYSLVVIRITFHQGFFKVGLGDIIKVEDSRYCSTPGL